MQINTAITHQQSQSTCGDKARVILDAVLTSGIYELLFKPYETKEDHEKETNTYRRDETDRAGLSVRRCENGSS